MRRIGGQVRGLQRMVLDDRRCLEGVRQINVAVAAMCETALLVTSGHLTAAVDLAVKAQDGAAAVEEMIAALRAAMRQ